MKYAIYKNGKKYLVSDTKSGAENVKRNLIERENKQQNERNCFANLSIEIREIRECCDCVHYQECFFADQTTGICNSYKDAPKVIDTLRELPRVPFTVI